MPLIKCPECGHDISDQAPSCPNCGLPISTKASASKVDVNVEKFEITSKKWKKYYAWAIPLLIIGLPLFVFNLMKGVMSSATGTAVDTGSAGWFFIGLLASGIGGILFLIAVIGSWWERG